MPVESMNVRSERSTTTVEPATSTSASATPYAGRTMSNSPCSATMWTPGKSRVVMLNSVSMARPFRRRLHMTSCQEIGQLTEILPHWRIVPRVRRLPRLLSARARPGRGERKKDRAPGGRRFDITTGRGYVFAQGLLPAEAERLAGQQACCTPAIRAQPAPSRPPEWGGRRPATARRHFDTPWPPNRAHAHLGASRPASRCSSRSGGRPGRGEEKPSRR